MGCRHQIHLWSWLAVAVVLFLWEGFSLWYFGSLIPHSVLAKLATYPPIAEPWHDAAEIAATISFPINFSLSVPSLLTGIATIGAVVGLWTLRHTPVIVLGLWTLFDFCFYALPNRYLFPWYALPLEGPFLLLTLIGLSAVIGRLTSWRAQIVRAVGTVFALLTLVALLLAAAEEMPGQRFELAHRENVYACVGSALEHGTSRQLTLAAAEIGAAGYFYRGPILDLAGLVSPVALAYYRDPGYVFHFPHVVPIRLLEDTRPDLILTFSRQVEDFVDSAWGQANYQTVAEYHDLHPYYGTLLLYRRNDVSLEVNAGHCQP